LEDLTDEQRKILASFPEADRGVVSDEAAKVMPAVADDPVEAAAYKAKMKQEKMRERRRLRELEKKEGFISKSVKIGRQEDFDQNEEEGEEDDLMDDEEFDSDEFVYDSEEEEAEEAKHRAEREAIITNGKGLKEAFVFDESKAEEYDANVQSKQNQKMKAAPGVKFEEFDEHGINKKEGLTKFITTDDTEPDYFIKAPPEMLAKAQKRPQGVFRDYDMDEKNLDDESKFPLLLNTL